MPQIPLPQLRRLNRLLSILLVTLGTGLNHQSAYSTTITLAPARPPFYPQYVEDIVVPETPLGHLVATLGVTTSSQASTNTVEVTLEVRNSSNQTTTIREPLKYFNYSMSNSDRKSVGLRTGIPVYVGRSKTGCVTRPPLKIIAGFQIKSRKIRVAYGDELAPDSEESVTLAAGDTYQAELLIERIAAQPREPREMAAFKEPSIPLPSGAYILSFGLTLVPADTPLMAIEGLGSGMFRINFP